MDEALSIATVSLDGGGRIGLCRLPGRLGRLAADLDTIAAWKPKIVVSLTELGEMQRYGSEALGERLARSAVDWRHFPVRDYGAPEGAMPAWQQLASDLHAILDRGGAVLLHCQGGRGRSGMIGLRLLVERGEEAAAALARVRSVRPGAVETDAQLAWASAGFAG